MDASTIILTTGALTITNEVIFNHEAMNWKIPIATGFGALIFAGLQAAIGEPAVALAGLALVASLLVSPAGGKPLANNLADWVK